MRPLWLFLLGAVPAFSAPFSFGVKAGVPLTDLFSTVQNLSAPPFGTTTNRYLIGPTAELKLPFGLGIEVDALYRHFDGNVGSASGSGSAWEIPLLGKYRFPGAIVRPYVDAGVAWNNLSGLTNTITTLRLDTTTTTGFVIGAGLDVHALFLHLSPEIRYTRWGAQRFLDPNGGFSSNQNQAEFMLGITF
ncbi:MAG: hypothetical protein C5B51_24465 [Terriglobia bacterium]|nr:MAG: hypothetical protein C5B51_24465 [Terriglobia bacterium]